MYKELNNNGIVDKEVQNHHYTSLEGLKSIIEKNALTEFLLFLSIVFNKVLNHIRRLGK